jgi:hypothetical protein
MVLVAEQHDRALARGFQAGERDRVVGQLDRDDPRARGPLGLDPGLLPGLDPVDARPPDQRVALGQRSVVGRHAEGAEGLAAELGHGGWRSHPRSADPRARELAH